MLQCPPTCANCIMPSVGGEGFSLPEGTGSLGVLGLGEALGQHELQDGLPFRPQAQAGSVLERAIQRSGFSRQQFRLHNVIACFPGCVLVCARGVQRAYKRWYSGPLVEITTNRGILPGTPNHPALTTRGWMALDEVKKGDYLVHCTFREGMPFIYPHITYSPTRFDDAFDSFSLAGVSERMIGRDMDFHGDGKQSEVNIVDVDRLLWDGPQPPRFEHIFKHTLKPTYTDEAYLLAGSARERVFSDAFPASLHASKCVMRRCSEFGTLLGSESREAEVVSFAAISYGDASTHKQGLYAAAPDLCLDAERFQRFPVDVSLTEVVEVKRSWFSGHVYNLQTHEGKYTANGFIVSNCHPPNDYLEGAPYEVAALEHCKQYWQQTVKEMRPRVIVTFGNVPTRVLTGLAGEKLSISYLRGYVLPTPWGLVLPTFHPSYIARGKSNLFGVLCHDLQHAVQIAKLELEEAGGYARDYEEAIAQRRANYLLQPSESDVRDFVEKARSNPFAPLAYDVETDESPYVDEDERGVPPTIIKSAQFSTGKGNAIFLVWQKFKDAVRILLALRNPKLGFYNWKFDDVKLRQWGYSIQGLNIDLYWGWHHLQPDLPGHLQFVGSFYRWPFPWKHLAASDPEFYGCCDVDVLHYICGGDEEVISSICQRQGFSADSFLQRHDLSKT